jgi:hypothetical protein
MSDVVHPSENPEQVDGNRRPGGEAPGAEDPSR